MSDYVIPTTGIAFVGEVAKQLGVTNYNLTYLCGNQHSYTNKWSLFKPVRFSALNPDRDNVDTVTGGGTINQFIFRDTGRWFRGDNGCCGLNVVAYPTIDALLASRKNETYSDWAYLPPNDITKYPARIADFGGYWHDAPAPFRGISVPSTIAAGRSYSVSLLKGIVPAYGTPTFHHHVELADIHHPSVGWLNALYFGFVALAVVNGVEQRIGVYYENVSAMSGLLSSPKYNASASMPSTYPYGTEIRIVPFLAKATANVSGSAISNLTWGPFFTVPDMGEGIIEVAASSGTTEETYGFEVFSNPKFVTVPTGNSVYLQWNYGIKNGNAAQYTARDVYIAVDKGTTRVHYESIGTVQVPGSSTWEETQRINAPNMAAGGGKWSGSYYAEFGCTMVSSSGTGAGQYKKRQMIMMPATMGQEII